MFLKQKKPYYADSMAFLAPHGDVPKFSKHRRPSLALAHLTSVPPWVKDFEQVLAAHDMFAAQALSNPDMKIVETRADLIVDGSMGLLFGMQNAPEHMSLERMRILKDRGLRAMSLAYDEQNENGDGCKGNGKLTRHGEEMIVWMAECGIILDLSHAGHETARGALAFIREAELFMRPMTSHSGCYSIFPHKRNVPDDILRSIAELGGYIGIPLVTFLLAKEGSPHFDEFARHVSKAVSVMGADKVGIGSDCPYVDMTMAEAMTRYDAMATMLGTRGSFGEYFPDRPELLIKNGSRLFEILTERLKLDPGFCGLNFKEFLNRSLPRE